MPDMGTLIQLLEDQAKHTKAASKLPGLSFQADPYTPPKQDFMAALKAIREKYPVRKLRKGEKGITEQLREWRDSH
ncbi:MAG: hypothetical protein RLZZ352_2681 [Pseudomonadota bacterium]|jgi:hypothetical protein